MAKRMSLIFLVFMIVPIIAPSIGAGVAALAGWRAIFFVFAAMSLLMIAWLRRLPETLEPQDVRRLDWRTMIAGWLTVTRHRRAAGDRKSTRLNSRPNVHLVCRILLEKKTTKSDTSQRVTTRLTQNK